VKIIFVKLENKINQSSIFSENCKSKNNSKHFLSTVLLMRIEANQKPPKC